MTDFQIGAKTWHSGNEITIVSEPFEKYGAQWQKGVDENGKEYTLSAPGQVKENIERDRREWTAQQAGFKRAGDLMRESGLW